MGVYFAATGFGNKIAGGIGEAAQTEPVHVELSAQGTSLIPEDASGVEVEQFDLVGTYEILSDGTFAIFDKETGEDLRDALILTPEAITGLKGRVAKALEKVDHQPTIQITMKESDTGYDGRLEVFEEQNSREFWTFISIFIFTVA